MLSKRDLQVVRTAIRWKWITPEQGEDVLFLKRKFGDRFAIEEIMRRRGYVRGEELEQLAEAANQVVGRRGRPHKALPAPERAPAKPGPAVTAAQGLGTGARAEQPVAQSRGAVPSFAIPNDATEAPSDERSASTDLRTQAAIQAYRFDPNILRTTIARPLSEAKVEPSFDDTPAPTIVAPLPAAVREQLLKGIRAKAPLDEPDQEKTMIADREQIERLRREIAAKGIQIPRDFGKKMPEPTIADEDDDIELRTRVDIRAAIAQPAAPRTIYEPRPPVPPPVPSATFDPYVDTDEGAVEGVERASGASQPARPNLGPRTRSLYGEESIPTAPPEVEAERVEGEDALVGRQFGLYAIQRVIAHGKRGVIYLALDPEQNPVALKVLSPEQEDLRGFLVRFQEQARRIAAIDSPHVVKILDLGSVEGRHYFATQYVDAWTLEERLDTGDRPDLLESLRIARGVALGLEAAERSGVVHGDVNPDNILIGPAGEVMLKGFGLPNQIRVKSTHRDLPILGTLGYLAPEQAVGAEADRRADLYALGATLFHMLTGRRAFEGTTPMAVLARVLVEDAPKIRTIDPSVPDSVAAIVDRLLAQSTNARFQSAAELIPVLEQTIASLQARGAPVVAAPRAETARALTLKAAAFSAAALALAIGLPLLLGVLKLAGWSASRAALQAAFLGSVALLLALMLLSALGLVRRGELPLPMSSAWLVRLQDAAGAIGAAFLVAGIVVGPLAILNVIVSGIAVLVLASWIYGILLRRTIALLRPDRGVGRMLAVLGDPGLARWRRVHVPLLATLCSLSAMRLAFLAYFAASGSVLS